MKTLRAFWLRLARTVHVEPRDSFAEELEGHLQMHTEDNVRKGMSATEARREALMKLGGVEQTKELYHDRQTLPILEVFMQDLRYGLRMLRKNPGFTAVAVLSLALGIGANTTIFTVVNAILLHPLPVKDISQVVELDTIDTKTKVGFANATKLGMSFPNCQDYQKQKEAFSGLSCIVPIVLTWSGGAEPRQVNGQMVSANYFEVLGLQPAAGRFFLPEEDTKINGK